MTEFHTGRDIRLDTSDTHKYGEILLHSENGEICTVHPIDGNEDMPNFPLCHLIAAAPDLYDALSNLVELSERLDFSEGYCCCGDEVENHSFGSGHSPVDAGDYYSMQAIKKARAALAKARGEP